MPEMGFWRNMTAVAVSSRASGASKLDGARTVFCLFLVMALGAGCSHEASARAPEQTQLQIFTISKGAQSGIKQRLLVTVKDKEGWADLWAQHTSRVVPVPMLPEVDFSREMVVAAFMGEKRTGGYDIEIISATRTAEAVSILFTERAPAPDRFVIQVLTHPYHVVRVARTDLPVTFVRQRSRGAVKRGTVSP